MNFDEVIAKVSAELRSEGRLAYRMIKRRYALGDEDLEDLKAYLIDARRVAVDEDGKVLVWCSKGEPAERRATTPATYTPAHLAERIRAQQVALEARAGQEGERKTITVLFADLKGSTALLEGLDPEDARALLDPALRLMMDAVHRYEGYVAQALGDGILALFGAPLAQEDHAQRAVYAALAMQEALQRHADVVRLRHGVALAVRIGLNTGEVVVRSIRKDDLHTDYVPVGHSINLAARMEQMAAPGSILITEHTFKLVDGYVAVKALGETTVKGVDQPLAVYEVCGPGPYRTRLQRAMRRGLTRFVGRQRELGHLLQTLEEARNGQGQVVGVMGEPGMGKSRLFHEFKQLAATGCVVLEGYAVSYGRASPYLPVIEFLKNFFEIQAHDGERARREKIIGRVLGLERTLEDTLPYLFALLGVDGEAAVLAALDPQQRRRRTFESLRRVILSESADRPVVLIFEDLHWVDSETLGLLDNLVECLGNARILLLTNYRPEFRHAWGGKSWFTQLRLAPLGREEGEELLTDLLEPSAAGTTPEAWQSLRRTILARTEGTPFFIEEVVQELFEQGVLARDATHAVTIAAPGVLAPQLPATVQGVLAARIDRLGPAEKSLLQQLAVIGRDFPLGLVRQVVEDEAPLLEQLLGALKHKEFLYELPAYPDVEYSFKHALTQEVAYQSLLIEQRKAVHERTAQAIERMYADELERHVAELAHHYDRSGNRDQALRYLEQAGLQATRQAANVDAVACFSRALDHLSQLDGADARPRDELRLLLALGIPLRMMRGMASRDVEQHYLRARELCPDHGTPLDLLNTLAGLRTLYCVRGDAHRALACAREMTLLAAGQADPIFELQAETAMTISLFTCGAITEAVPHADRVLACYAPDLHRQDVLVYGFDPKVMTLGYRAITAQLMGATNDADDYAAVMADTARAVAHPYVDALVIFWTAWLRGLGGATAECRTLTAALLEHTAEHDFPDFTAYGHLLHGWATALLGDERGGEELLRSIAFMASVDSELAFPLQYALAAEAHLSRRDAPAAHTAIEQGLAAVARNGEEFYAPELYRLLAECELMSAAADPVAAATAADHYETAVAIAQRQGALLLELRATLGLARLWANRGCATEAHGRLAAVQGRFTQGQDLPEVVAARDLLEHLKQ